MSGLNTGGSYRPLIVETAVSTLKFLTCSSWAVNMVIVEERVFLWRSRTRPSFETKWLSRPEDLAALTDLPGQWIDKVHQRRPPKTIVLDMDSSESPTYGEQEGSAYNGHFGCMCYHPVFVFNQLGDVEGCALQPGNVHSA